MWITPEAHRRLALPSIELGEPVTALAHRAVRDFLEREDERSRKRWGLVQAATPPRAGERIAAMNLYVDYTLGPPIRLTRHARIRMRQRDLTFDDVWYILAHHRADVEGDEPWKREVTGSIGGRTVTVVIVPLPNEVRVVTVIDED